MSAVEFVPPAGDAELPPVAVLLVAPPVGAGSFVPPPTSYTGGTELFSGPPQPPKVRPSSAINGDENASLNDAITSQDVSDHELEVTIHQRFARMHPLTS